MNKRLEQVHEKAIAEIDRMNAVMEMLTMEKYAPLVYSYEEQIGKGYELMDLARSFIQHIEILREAREHER